MCVDQSPRQHGAVIFNKGKAANRVAQKQGKINGDYRVGESGGVRLPLLVNTVAAKGLTSEQFARSAEAAYRNAGVYTRPAIEVETVRDRAGDC